MKERNRHDLLKGGIGIAAGAIGIGAVAPVAAASSGLTLRLDGTGVTARVHGASRGRLAKLDDHVTIHGLITDERGTQGTFGATGVAVRVPGADGLALLEHHVFVVGDSTLTGAGQRVGTKGTFAVTGGTGTFTGARGSYVAHLDPSGLGGDGTARFEFNLTIQER